MDILVCWYKVSFSASGEADLSEFDSKVFIIDSHYDCLDVEELLWDKIKAGFDVHFAPDGFTRLPSELSSSDDGVA